MSVISTLRHLYHERMAGKRKVGQSVNVLPGDVLHTLRTKGYAIVPGFFDAALCDEIRSVIDRIAASPEATGLREKVDQQPKLGWPVAGGYQIWTDAAGSDFRIIHAEKLHNGIQQYFENASLRDTGSLFLDRPLIGKHCMANRTRFVPGNAGSGGGWRSG